LIFQGLQKVHDSFKCWDRYIENQIKNKSQQKSLDALFLPDSPRIFEIQFTYYSGVVLSEITVRIDKIKSVCD
jgi:hypothetical protein